jgi:hypothetical protein
MDVDAGRALRGQAGLNELAEQLQEGLDATEGFAPQGDLRGARERDGGFLEEEVDAEDGVLVGRERALSPGPSPVRPAPTFPERESRDRRRRRETEGLLF